MPKQLGPLASMSALLLAAQPLASQSVSFTAAQAQQGRALYDAHCVNCHGTQLSNGNAVPLAGPVFRAKWSQAEQSLDELFRVLRTTMPSGAPNTLSTDEYLAVFAYVLEQNGQQAGERALTADRAALGAARLAAAPAAQGPRTVQPDFAVGPRGPNPTTSEPTHAQLKAGIATGRDWLTHTHDYSGARYSPLAQVNVANASRLNVECAYQLGTTASFQTGPVVFNGVVYVTAGYSTFAIDGATCRPKWRHDWKSPAAAIGYAANRGVAIKDGRVVRATADGFLIALDAATGTLLWSRRVSQAAKGELITMAPLIYDDLIFLGPAVSEYAIRGWVGAFKLSDGERVWRFNIVPEPGEPGSETWKQDSSLPVGGGAVWTPLSLDVEREILFVPAANPAPDFPVKLRGGTNLYTNSIIALEARTGKLVWFDQIVPLDDHDWDLTQVSPLYRANAKGKTRNLVATAGKDGRLRVLDRDSHERLFESPLTTIENASAPVTTAGVHACPGIFGGVQWNGPTYHPASNLLITGAVDWCGSYFLDDEVKFVPFQNYLGGRVVLDTVSKGWVTAVNASTGAQAWRYASRKPVVGAVTSTAGGVVFVGELTGELVALDVRTGKVLYRHYTGGQIGAGVVTYQAGSRQFVAVASGTTSGFWPDAFPGSPTITVFALPANRAR